MERKIKKLGKKTGKLTEKPEVEKVSPLKKTKIRVIGIGGGGGNIVSELAQRVKKASFLAANTDLPALKQLSKKVKSFPFGQNFTSGLGTGMNPQLAEMASENEKEKIKKIFQGQDLVIFIACLGGGTGSGATPVFARLAKNQNLLSYGIFTLPFKFEGERKMEIAMAALENLRPKLNAITVLPNERIFQIVNKNTPLKEALSSINKILAQALEGLIETIYQPGLINIDFSDLRTVLEGWGRVAYLNTLSFTKKEERVDEVRSRQGLPSSSTFTKARVTKEVVERALSSPLYPYGVKGAKGVLFNIVGQKEISLEEVSQISQTISEKTNPEAKIIFGISPGGKYQNIIKTTIFATGLSVPKVKKLRQRKIKKPVAKIKSKKPAEVKPQIVVKKNSEETKLPTAEVKSKKKALTRPKGEKKEKKVKPSPEVKATADYNQPTIFRGKTHSYNSPVIIHASLIHSKEELSTNHQGKTQSDNPSSLQFQSKNEKIRKNALQLKKEIEEEEKEMLEKEKFWERPTFLRQKKAI